MSSGRPITDDDRDRIMTGIASGESARQIGLALGRHHSIISREIDRNGGPEAYQSRRAATRANEMKSRPQERKLERSRRLHEEVSAGLDAQWSPEQISNRLVKDFPDEATMHVSHETIYQTLFVQARGQCRTQLRPALRTGRAHRVPRGSTRPAAARITDMKSIHDRPAEAEDRQVPGHWESDLIIGLGGKSQVLTLLERTTRFLILQKIPYDRRAERVAIKLREAVGRLPLHLWRSITHDQGTEMAAHAWFTIATDIDIFFADPHSPHQRGTNETPPQAGGAPTNGLVRQYLKKGIDLEEFSQTQPDRIADQLNGRPRKVLDWSSPAEALNEVLVNASSL
jgi:transposase, IS30 family